MGEYSETFQTLFQHKDQYFFPKVDPATQIHISGTGDWGHCNPNCPSGRNLNQVEEAIEDIPDEPCKTIFGDDGICQVSKS